MRLHLDGRADAPSAATAIAMALSANLVLKAAAACAVGGRALAERIVPAFAVMVAGIIAAQALTYSV